MDLSNLKPVTIPETNAAWTTQDLLGALKVRFSLGRGNYTVEPGLYKMGNPDEKSEVFVSANYKLSFDVLRKNLDGINAWILVLQTYGINVWCAAGKGTFGTDELIKQIKFNQLHLYVPHKRVIVPQLGAPGVAAHQVKSETGFTVKFGPVRAEDIRPYLKQGLKKDKKQRSVYFDFFDRLILTPVEFVNNLKYLAAAIILFTIMAGLSPSGYSLLSTNENAFSDIFMLTLAYITGSVIAPLLLPVLPFRAFAGKGLFAGMLMSIFVVPAIFYPITRLYFTGWILLSGAIVSYLTLNFTGASTYTSLSGVKKEMRFYVPLQIMLAFTGLCLLIISKIQDNG